jgi:hypothetical protein
MAAGGAVKHDARSFNKDGVVPAHPISGLPEIGTFRAHVG